MATNKDYMKTLLGKLDELPPERVVEVEDFVDFLRHREQDQHLVHGAMRASQVAFQKVWNNPEDAVYDRL
jgi:hypothetical protein